jgi:hypothetical protein
MNPDQELALRNALGTNIQMALPQTVQPVIKTQHQVQRTQYDPEKLQALVSALTSPRKKQQIEKDRWELLGNALASNIVSPEFEGAYGVKFTNPYLDALSSGVNVFNSIYGAQQQQARDLANQDIELENQAREDAIKAAQLEAEATKQAITDQEALDWMKVNDPNAKSIQAAQEQANMKLTLNNMMSDLENIGTRFDSSFKNIDEMQKDSTRWGRMMTNGFFGAGVSDKEKLARDQFDAWKRSMQNVLVNANRQAGSGTMSDADAERYEQNILKAKNPAQARNILDSFVARMSMTPLNKREYILDENNINMTPKNSSNGKKLTADDIWKQLGE